MTTASAESGSLLRPADTPRTRAPPFPAWGNTSPAARALILNKIADRIACRALAHQERTFPQNK